jgi:branched-chain amino acid transport system substrate-binding protein
VTVGNEEPVYIAVELTLSGSNAPYGVDALRGVEMAIADRGDILKHPIKLIQADDLCSAEGGQAAAQQLVTDKQILGVIGATCSSATEKAAKVISDAGLVLISPSSTAASLTGPNTHQPGFLRTIYNDQSQAKLVADFAFNALGARTMATIDDGSTYSVGLQQEACQLFTQRGGTCVAQLTIQPGEDPAGAVAEIAKFQPDALYIPLYTKDGMNVTAAVFAAGLLNTSIIGSDGLKNTDFATKARNADGVYASGPGTDVSQAFIDKYKARYGEEPIAAFALQAYDAAMILFNAIAATAKTTGRDFLIQRSALRAAVYATANYPGLSGLISCSPLGDCAPSNIVIYQLDNRKFRVVYP